jgi:hypothetical protein
MMMLSSLSTTTTVMINAAVVDAFEDAAADVAAKDVHHVVRVVDRRSSSSPVPALDLESPPPPRATCPHQRVCWHARRRRLPMMSPTVTRGYRRRRR